MKSIRLLLVTLVFFTACDTANMPPPPPGSRTVPTPRDLEFAGATVSPVIVVPPVMTCGISVTVRGFIPGALIRIFQDGAKIGEAMGIDPEGQTFSVLPNSLQKDKMITATQEFDKKQSLPSAAEQVKDHTEIFPDGLPQPEFPILDLYNCGIATVNDHLPAGGELRVFSRDPAPGAVKTLVGNVKGVSTVQSVGIGPAFITGRIITAESQICTDISPVSEEQTVQAAPTSLPKPEVADIYDNGLMMVIHQLINGANVTIKRAGSILGGGGAPGPNVHFPLNATVFENDKLEIVQELCGVNSEITTVVVKPCSTLPAPQMLAPRPGDIIIYLTGVEPGTTVWIFAGGKPIGHGGGSAIVLDRPLLKGETLLCVQGQGTCVSATAGALEVGNGLNDPLRPGVCSVNKFEYGGPDDVVKLSTDISSFFNTPDEAVAGSINMNALPLHGVVRFPSGPGPFPLVLIVHGNHDPREKSFPGYDYLLDQLASHCIIAVSVEEDFLNGWVNGEIDARAIVLLRHLQLWRTFSRTPGNQFYGKVDMGNIGLAGHSRGGEAICAAALFNKTLHTAKDAAFNFNFGIKGLYAIAPVDGGVETGPITLQKVDYYVMHGSHDGDVSDFQGHQMFDRALPVNVPTTNFKGLLWVYGANHAQWNTVWSGAGDPNPVNPTSGLISANDERTIGQSYLTAFFLASLKGWTSYRYFLNGEVTFPSLPATIKRVTEYQDPKRIFLDHYEEDNDLSSGSFPAVANKQTGSLKPYEQRFFQLIGPPFFMLGETNGLIAGWQNTENGEIHIVLPSAIRSSIKDFEFLAFHAGQNFETNPVLNNPALDKDMSVQLVVNNTPGPQLKISDYAKLPYPAITSGGTENRGVPKTIKQTIRIPWKDLLGNIPKERAKEVNEIVLKFNRANSGLMAIDEIQLTN